jgi:phenylpyruvate tautomerase PptA (4-oxalocrotonate tautomerase family)
MVSDERLTISSPRAIEGLIESWSSFTPAARALDGLSAEQAVTRLEGWPHSVAAARWWSGGVIGVVEYAGATWLTPRRKAVPVMAQIKVYALRATIEAHRGELSEAIHESVMEAFRYPREKRFQRFIALEREDFVFPADRSDRYTVIEVSVFEGRSVEAKKALVRALYRNVARRCGIDAHDLEITIFETPRANWGIRGVPGDELTIAYDVEV